MVSMILKANIFSIVYLLFIFRYVQCSVKIHLLVRLVKYMSICFVLQYVLFLLNLTAQSAPQTFPYQFARYPMEPGKGLAIRYSIPFFFQFETFRDLRLCYLVGVGLTKEQINNLLLDFLSLYLVCMYILNYRNPLLVKSMRKVFWCFPDTLSAAEEWRRLDPLVQKQVRWLQHPRKVDALGGKLYKDYLNHITVGGTRDRRRLDLAEKQYEFAIAYQKYHDCEHRHGDQEGHSQGEA